MQGLFPVQHEWQAPPAEGQVINALAAYSYPIGDRCPDRQGTARTCLSLDCANKGGYTSIARAKMVAQNCAICHGRERRRAEGRRPLRISAAVGRGTRATGARGMHRINTAAAFIKENMPARQGGTLSDDDAWHVAAFMNSHERPQDPRLVDGSIDKTRERYHANDGVNLYGVRVDGVLLARNRLSWSLCWYFGASVPCAVPSARNPQAALSGVTLSWVLSSKSDASWRSCAVAPTLRPVRD